VGRDEFYVELILVSEKQKYFCLRGWTGGSDLPIAGKSLESAAENRAGLAARQPV
jgi:hypothetical protein